MLILKKILLCCLIVLPFETSAQDFDYYSKADLKTSASDFAYYLKSNPKTRLKANPVNLKITSDVSKKTKLWKAKDPKKNKLANKPIAALQSMLGNIVEP